MKKGEMGADLSGEELTRAPKRTQLSREYTLCYHLLFITTSLGLMEIQWTKVINEENQTFYIQPHKLEVENIAHTDHDFFSK